MSAQRGEGVSQLAAVASAPGHLGLDPRFLHRLKIRSSGPVTMTSILPNSLENLSQKMPEQGPFISYLGPS